MKMNKLHKGILWGLAIVLPLWFMVGWALSATYYVSESGDASAPTTPVAADCWDMSDFNGAAATLEPGDTIYVLDTVRAQMTIPESGTVGLPYTIRGDYAGHPGIISGADIVSTWTANLTWADTYTETPSATFDNANDYNLRAIITAAAASNSGTKVRISIKAGTNGATVDGVSIGEREGSTQDYDATPTSGAGVTRVTFDSNNYIAIGAGATEVSDEITYVFDEAIDHLVHIWWGGGTSGAYEGSGGDTFYREYGTGLADLTMTEDTSMADTQTDWKSPVVKIEVATGTANVWQATLATEPLQVFFDDTKGTNESGACPGDLDTDQEWCWDSNVLYQHSTSDPDTRYTTIGTEASQRQYGILATSKEYLDISEITVVKAGAVAVASYNIGFDGTDNSSAHDLLVQDGHHSGISLIGGSSDNLLYNIESTENGAAEGVGIGVWNPSADNNEVYDNNVHDNYGTGITNHGLEASHDGPDGTLIYRNTIVDNGRKGISVTMALNTVIEYNFVDGNGTLDAANGDGIRVGAGDYATPWGTGNIIRYNLISNNRVNGLVLYREIGPKAYYNIFDTNGDASADVGASISVTGFDGGEIYNNTMYNPRKFGMSFQDDLGTNIKYYNNIMHSSSGRAVCIWLYDNADGGIEGDNNFCYNLANYGQIQTGGAYSLANWIIETGQDTNSSTDNPLLVLPASDDFTLQAGSSAINTGIIPAGFEAIFPLDPTTVVSPWGPVVATGDRSLREIGAFAYFVGGLPSKRMIGIGIF